MDGKEQIREIIEDTPVIMAVKDWEGVRRCTGQESKVVFILFGDVCSIDEIVKTVKDAGKIAIVHIDLISGLGNKEISVDFIRKATEADGIISTKPAMIKRGKELGLFTILRFFVLDSMALAFSTSTTRASTYISAPNSLPYGSACAGSSAMPDTPRASI